MVLHELEREASNAACGRKCEGGMGVAVREGFLEEAKWDRKNE